MAPFSAVKSDTSPQCPNTSCRGAAIRFIEIDHCRRGKPGGAFLALEPIPPLELLALLREENWGSGLFQTNDSSSAIKAISSRSRQLLVHCPKPTPEARLTRPAAVAYSRQDVASVADIARPRVNDADEIVFGLEQSIAVTVTNCYVQRRLARWQEHQLGWGWINHSRLGQCGCGVTAMVVQKMQV